ncbi:MAG: flagellar biosynthesis protein FliQ [Eubacteriales bacterium]
MDQSTIITVMQDAVRTTLMVSLPMIGIALVIGLIISVFQAATQVNEQTMTFLPKLVGILLVLLVFGGYILSNLTEFTSRMFSYAVMITG